MVAMTLVRIVHTRMHGDIVAMTLARIVQTRIHGDIVAMTLAPACIVYCDLFCFIHVAAYFHVQSKS